MFALMPRRRNKTALVPRTETPFDLLPKEYATLFNRFFPAWPALESPEWEYPWGLTMEENDKEVVARVELPGFAPEEVKVELVGDLLRIEAEHMGPAENGKEEAKRAYVKREITLPPDVEPDKVEAVQRNGVLEVHLPRKPEAARRRIEVKT